MGNRKGNPLNAWLMDWVMAPMDTVRARLVPDARGRVLEIGFGTGLNLPHYDFGAVTGLTAIEPDPYLRVRAERRTANAGRSVEVVDAVAETLPFAAESFDEVVMTFTLCTVKDPERALGEIHRVLRPGGRLLFAEHTVSDHRPMRWLQHAVDPLWAWVAGGCRLTRDATDLVGRAGFQVGEVHGHGRTPLAFAPIHRGLAVKPD